MGQGQWAKAGFMRRAHGLGPMGQGPAITDNDENYVSEDVEPQRYYESIPTSSASRSLTCQKTKENNYHQTPTFGRGDGGGINFLKLPHTSPAAIKSHSTQG